MNELALFAGAGGGLLASKWMFGWRTICYVEWDWYCISILKKRISEGYLDEAPIWDDARTFDGRPWNGKVDVVSAGFPCQPFSVAGQQRGHKDERNMWPDTIRIIREVQPRYCFMENVSGLLAHEYFGTILRDLAESGYDAVWKVISAAEVGAPHRRDRLWIVAMDNTTSRRSQESNEDTPRENSIKRVSKETSQDVAHLQGKRRQGRGLSVRSRKSQQTSSNIIRGGEDAADTDTGFSGQQRQKIRSRRNPINISSTWWQTDPADLPIAESERIQERESKFIQTDNNLPDTGNKGLEGAELSRDDEEEALGGQKGTTGTTSERDSDARAEGPTESRLGRVVDGMANRVDRLKAIGNGEVPKVAAVAWDLLSAKLRGEGE